MGLLDRKPAPQNGLLNGIEPVPVQNPLARLLASGLSSAANFAGAPFGYANPPANALLNLLGVPSVVKTLENVAYGMPLTTGSGQTLKMKPETQEALLAVAPLAPATKGLPVGMSIKPVDRTLALEEARRNAVKMLGLPENNTAMDRAAALGFKDEGLLHGTTNDFPAFTVNERRNVYATDDPKIADIYANATGRHMALREVNAGPNVIPLMSRGNRLEVSDFRDGNGGWMNDNIGEALGIPVEPRKMFKKLPEHGYQSARVEMDDLGGRQVQYVFPEPSVLRSRFAAFDPARINQNDLLAGFVPLSMLYQEESKK